MGNQKKLKRETRRNQSQQTTTKEEKNRCLTGSPCAVDVLQVWGNQSSGIPRLVCNWRQCNVAASVTILTNHAQGWPQEVTWFKLSNDKVWLLSLSIFKKIVAQKSLLLNTTARPRFCLPQRTCCSSPVYRKEMTNREKMYEQKKISKQNFCFC